MSLPARLRAFGISKALDYLERDPDANLPKLMDWLDKYTGERLASPYRELFHRAMSDPGNNWHRLIKSMYTDIDSRVLKKIFENFVIHAGLMDWPSRNAAGELGNGRAPWAVIIDPSFPCEMGCRGCGASIYGVRPYMEFDSLDEEIEARKGRGCHLFIFSGGNPLAREQETIALCNKHTDCVFAAFTPPFGVACRCTAENAERVATELYYDRVIATGAKFCWFFTCPAYGPEQPASLEQLEAIHRRVQEFRRSKPLLTLDFWDGPSPSAAAPQGGTA